MIPCPILEFRVTNRMHHVSGGEIIDSTINVVASVDASQVCSTQSGARRRTRAGNKKGKTGGRTHVQNSNRRSLRTSVAAVDSKRHGKPCSDSDESIEDLLANLSRHETQEITEDPTGHLMAKMKLSKVDCESQEHPFFKRVWMIRHTLDERSPLLNIHARQMVQQSGGFWPNELNSAEGVRNSLQFDQLLVSFSGMSNADANTVYAQHIYDSIDVLVGYQFVNMLYNNPSDGALRIDPNLISDVKQQDGGGGEEFTTQIRSQEKFHHMFVL